jgi:hypothetical protein
MDIRNKPKYVSPQVFAFGDLVKEERADCQSGYGATGNCHNGIHATQECQTGTTHVTPECQPGSGASSACHAGNSARSHCDSGNNVYQI